MEGALYPPWSGGPTADLLLKNVKFLKNENQRFLCDKKKAVTKKMRWLLKNKI